VTSAIATCKGSIAAGHPIRTGRVGTVRFVVTAVDKSGNRATRTVDYVVWEYVNPLKDVSGLTPRRIDLGVDYAGSGPLLALGRGRVTMASDVDSGPPSCWAISCWPGGGIVVYRLLDGRSPGSTFTWQSTSRSPSGRDRSWKQGRRSRRSSRDIRGQNGAGRLDPALRRSR
jgi:hypothetical protein